MSETVLWTNASPTSSLATQNLTLTDSMFNYSYLGVYYRFTTSDTSEARTIVIPSELTLHNPKFVQGFLGSLSITVGSGTTTEWTRFFCRADDTGNLLYMYSCTKTTGGSGGQNNSYLIPTKIVGIK